MSKLRLKYILQFNNEDRDSSTQCGEFLNCKLAKIPGKRCLFCPGLWRTGLEYHTSSMISFNYLKLGALHVLFNVFMGLRGILLYPAAKDSSRMPFPPLCVRMRFLILLDLPTTIKEGKQAKPWIFFRDLLLAP